MTDSGINNRYIEACKAHKKALDELRDGFRVVSGRMELVVNEMAKAEDVERVINLPKYYKLHRKLMMAESVDTNSPIRVMVLRYDSNTNTYTHEVLSYSDVPSAIKDVPKRVAFLSDRLDNGIICLSIYHSKLPTILDLGYYSYFIQLDNE